MKAFKWNIYWMDEKYKDQFGQGLLHNSNQNEVEKKYEMKKQAKESKILHNVTKIKTKKTKRYMVNILKYIVW